MVTSEKGGFGHLEKANSKSKFTITVKNFIFNNLEGSDFKYNNSVFETSVQNTKITEILVPNLILFVYRKTFSFDKFEGANFKYDKSFFNILV